MNINGYEFELDENIKNLLNDYPNNYLPPKNDIFKALELTKLEDVKVVILGQDPYPTKGNAMGLSFSVKKEQAIPKSLKNIFLELKNDLGIEKENGDLTSWAEQGVLLLNTILTVEEGKAGSHAGMGWENTTNTIIKQVADRKEVVFVLLGKNAAKYKNIIGDENYIIELPHPSPLSAYRGFLGSSLFSNINEILTNIKKEKIEW